MTTLIDEALEALRSGTPVLVADSLDRENEVDAILAAELATPKWIGWMIRHTSGYLCAPMAAELADRLDLPLMVPSTQDPRRTAYTISVDAASQVTTGISATDRATTLRVLADPAARPADLIRPGHVLPLRAVPGGIRERAGHTEAAVDLCRAAGLAPVGVIGELVGDDGEVLRLDAARSLARRDGLVIITIAELGEALGSLPAPAPRRVRHISSSNLPTRHGNFTIHGYRDLATGAEHVALVPDQPQGSSKPALVRVQSECLTGEALGSLRCECGPQLEESMRRVARRGGAVVYLRGHEGRGIGLLDKIAAYDLQDHGRNTLTANLELGFDGDGREYGAAAAILTDLGLRQIELLTNNPAKQLDLSRHGIDVVRTEPLLVGLTSENTPYLRTKADEMGHRIPAAFLTHNSVPNMAATTGRNTQS